MLQQILDKEIQLTYYMTDDDKNAKRHEELSKELID